MIDTLHIFEILILFTEMMEKHIKTCIEQSSSPESKKSSTHSTAPYNNLYTSTPSSCYGKEQANESINTTSHTVFHNSNLTTITTTTTTTTSTSSGSISSKHDQALRRSGRDNNIETSTTCSSSSSNKQPVVALCKSSMVDNLTCASSATSVRRTDVGGYDVVIAGSSPSTIAIAADTTTPPPHTATVADNYSDEGDEPGVCSDDSYDEEDNSRTEGVPLSSIPGKVSVIGRKS